MTEIYALDADKLATLYVWKDDNTNYVAKENVKQTLMNAFAGLHPNQIKAITDKPVDSELYFDSIQSSRTITKAMKNDNVSLDP